MTAAGGRGRSSASRPTPGLSAGASAATTAARSASPGLKFRITDIFALRLDVRDYATGKPFPLEDRSGLLHMLETSAGLSFVF